VSAYTASKQVATYILLAGQHNLIRVDNGGSFTDVNDPNRPFGYSQLFRWLPHADQRPVHGQTHLPKP